MCVLSLYIAFNINWTLDGPAHLYNARILQHLLLKNPVLEQFLEINPEIIPNYFISCMYGLLINYFDPLSVEKFINAICLLLLGTSSLLIIQKISKTGRHCGILIGLILFNNLLALGFYNFMFSLGFMNLSILFILKIIDQNVWKYWMVLILCQILLFLSHGLNFLICFGFMILIVLFEIIEYYINNKLISIKLLKIILGIIAISTPFIIILTGFIIERKGEDVIFLGMEELVEYISEFRFLLAYIETEIIYHRVIFLMFFGLLCILSYNYFNNIKRNQNKFKSVAWFAFVIILITSYFVLPNQTSGGGYISIRILLMVFIFSIYWMSSIAIPNYFFTCLLLIIQIPFIKSLNEKFKVQEKLSSKIESILDCETKIVANSIILPIYHGDNWLEGHYSNFLGINKPLVILENYEANAGYFPVKWKYTNPVKVFSPFPGYTNENFKGIMLSPEAAIDSLDYIMFYGHLEMSNRDSQTYLKCVEQHSLVCTNHNIKIFKLKY